MSRTASITKSFDGHSVTLSTVGAIFRKHVVEHVVSGRSTTSTFRDLQEAQDRYDAISRRIDADRARATRVRATFGNGRLSSSAADRTPHDVFGRDCDMVKTYSVGDTKNVVLSVPGHGEVSIVSTVAPSVASSVREKLQEMKASGALKAISYSDTAIRVVQKELASHLGVDCLSQIEQRSKAASEPRQATPRTFRANYPTMGYAA